MALKRTVVTNSRAVETLFRVKQHMTIDQEGTDHGRTEQNDDLE